MVSEYYQYLLMSWLFERITGYDTGVISGALVTIGSDLGPIELSNGQKVSTFFFYYAVSV